MPEGPTPRPKGERALGHGRRKPEEVSPGALANQQASPASTTHGSKGPGEECDPSEFELVRATTRFLIDLRALSDSANKKRSPGDKRIMVPEEKRVRDVLFEVARLTTTARNVGMRGIYRADSESLDRYLAEHGQMPKKSADWVTKLYSYKVMRLACPTLSSNIVATLQRDVDRKWSQERYDVLVAQNASPPHYRFGQPFPVPAAGVKFAWDVERGRAVCSFAVFSGDYEGDDKRLSLPIEAKDAHQKTLLQKLASGEWKSGQIMLERDRIRPGKWYLRVAYKRRVPKRTEGISAAVNRGISFFLACVTAKGESWLYDATDIEAYLKQIQRRRQQYQRASKASGRDGRGRTRILRPIEPLFQKGENWRKTKCQVVARRLARWLAERNVCRLYIEDFSGIRDGEPEKLEGGEYVWKRIQEWPYYQLQMRLEACLQEYGIETIVVGPHYISQRCPSCGHTAKENIERRYWKLKCVKCGWRRHLDVAAAMNVMARGEESRSGPPLTHEENSGKKVKKNNK
ncbi:MAG TPA: transposase [Nitrospirota bacterium]